ncbi:FdtA/QdtA family cupin domain-containing protein [Niallia sp. NCCP-28]|uniref:sugar 3,4-ketoisomerase n=1 Tax=Niallia sp. NCCP-28 TaxID=2934712 RepID=UPI0020884B85|nr:FdtA/QdtA family cupin domain-containing protein [Niallia sp. NCCP-28]GKU80698.1 dTDP-6-deoxy-3,4-keto-hexulose isomerase [Niallia sp. NCCP-28]
MEIITLDFNIKGDDRGSLIALEQNKNIPFNIKRVYYLFDTKSGVRRGFHAHHDLEQVLIVVRGSCKIHLDDLYQTREILLDNPQKGLYIGPLMWHEMYDFSDDCVLLVLASYYYLEEDYIRNYDQFSEIVSQHKKRNVGK